MSELAPASRNVDVNSGRNPVVLDAAVSRGPSARRLLLRRFLRHRLAALGLVVLVVLSVGAIFATKLTPYDPYKINMRDRLLAPSIQHLMGTDDLGRDQLARILLGGQVSLAVGFLSVLVALFVGVSIGSVAGFYGGKIDNILMRLTDLMFTFPPIILAMISVSVLGQSLVSIAFTIGIVSWMGLGRLVRASFLSLKEQEYVLAARAVGASNARIIISHILPNVVGTIIVAATMGIARAILLESALSYLGLGIVAPIPSWGSMLYTAQGQLSTATWLSLTPGLMIFIAILSINFLGDGLRDALDPRMQ
jgi:peptide/nickel transport system permease protein